MTDFLTLGRFSDHARKALALVADTSSELGQPIAGPEHILLAMLREGEGVAAICLRLFGISEEAAQTSLVAMAPSGTVAAAGETGLTLAARETIERAVIEAKALGHNYIGTEHLLLSILDEDDSLAWSMLKSLGVGRAAARTQTLRILAEQSEMPKGAGVKRYNLVLSDEMYQQVQARAEQENASVVDLLRRFVKLGLLAMRLAEEPDSGLIMRERGVERQILLL
jgi:ATP-dependent Clp protease ATP-binding subunit ClpA